MTFQIIRKQIFDLQLPVAANYRAVSRGRSEKERFAKLCIVVEELMKLNFGLKSLKN